MNHIRVLAGVSALCAGLTLLGACTPSQVNQGISTANSACQNIVPASESTAQTALTGGAANTAIKVSGYANEACQGVAQAVANESAIDSAVSELDSIWESVFGANTPTAVAAVPTPATAAPAPATATPVPVPAPTPAAPTASTPAAN